MNREVIINEKSNVVYNSRHDFDKEHSKMFSEFNKFYLEYLKDLKR